MTEKDIRIMELVKMLKGRSLIAKADYDKTRQLLEEGFENNLYGIETLKLLSEQVSLSRFQANLYDEIIEKLLDIVTE